MILPVYVDYLGCYEEGIDGVHSPPDVMRELHQRGVQDNRFLPGGELSIEEDKLVLRDSPQRVSCLCSGSTNALYFTPNVPFHDV